MRTGESQPRPINPRISRKIYSFIFVDDLK
jgi:hypothetical protein